MRAVCYLRVSSTKQRDADTIESQVRVLPAFVERQGWTLVRPVTEYVDDGFSAKAGHLVARTGFTSLIRDAVLGLFDVVVVMDVDRLTRSEDITERGAIIGAFQRAGVRLASAISGQVLDLSTSNGDLLTSIGAFFAAEFTRKHRARILEGRVTSAKRNRKPSGRTPFGLAFDTGAGTWALHPTNAPIVRELFERCVAGESLYVITRDFTRRGISGTLTSKGAVTHAGRIIRSRHPVGEWTMDRRKGLVLSVPAIVDEDVWQRAQLAIRGSKLRGLRRTRHEYLIEKLGACSQCGALVCIRSASATNRARYVCSARRAIGGACPAPSILVSDADHRLWSALRTELEHPDLTAAIGDEIVGQADEHDRWQQDADSYRAHLSRLERVEGSVLERYRRGLVSDGALDAELERLRRERSTVQQQLSAAEQARISTGAARERMDEALRTLSDLRAVLDASDFATRRRLVELLVPPGGVIFDENRLLVTLLVPRPTARGIREPLSVQNDSPKPLRIRVVA